jgi:hypothetical protein
MDARRPTDGLLHPGWYLGSVSAYYYTGGVGVFVGILVALSLFLFTYPGYEGERLDRWVGRIAGVSAAGVALFPTGAPPNLRAPSWFVEPTTRWIHYGCAITLFVCFIVFAGWLFRRSSVPRWSDRPLGKKWRDGIYLVCAAAMVLAIVVTVVAFKRGASIFVPEAVAIVAFAVSWLVKGEVYEPVVSMVQRLMPKGTP